ncbi:MAG: M67 family metallopeptidase [Anaerolineae bacterium]|nr:M67 family metallopeptidase [Anaerolineae bacterium]MDW8070074.1 M67 family metallopeptidase [Anaerolineae bacterium]
MRISGTCLRQILSHAIEAYPYECFGFLVGIEQEGGVVQRVERGTNVLHGQPARFEMDAVDFVRTAETAEHIGMAIIGFYHSHPDWPAIPSEEDLKRAWSGHYYLIVSIIERHPVMVTVWRLADDMPRRFLEAPLEVSDAI